MKRKRSTHDHDPTKCKKPSLSSTEEPESCKLLCTIQQYGILETIVKYLGPNDLLALLLTAKEIYRAVLPRPESISNLLGKMPCSGRGVELRKILHIPLTTEGWEEHVLCQSSSPGCDIEARPCHDCGMTTCNECRIHCVYQSGFERCTKEDEMHNYSGFVLLDPLEVPILSPHHLDMSDTNTAPKWQDPTNSNCQPYHDLGWLDVPYEAGTYGPPELVEGILDLNLGQHSFAFSEASNVEDPSPVLRAFHLATEKRKRVFCDNCLPQRFCENTESGKPHACLCTLRKHVLDQWTCLRCYEKSELALEQMYPDNIGRCSCRVVADKSICLWCSGVIHGTRSAG